MLNKIIYVMVRCLVLTVVFETSIAFLLGLRKKDLLNVVLVNIMTNPLVVILPVYFNIYYGLTSRNIVLLIVEILAVLTEGLIYKKYLNYKKINGLLLSLILNISSYLLGVIIYGF